VGASGLAAMRSISARASAMPASRAGFRYSTLARSNGGTPPYGPVQGTSSGLAAGAGSAALAAVAPARVAATAAPAIKDLKDMGLLAIKGDRLDYPSGRR